MKAEILQELLKPYLYEKYGKAYIGYKETEGALRAEGFIIDIQKALDQYANWKIKECLPEKIEQPIKTPPKQEEVFLYNEGYKDGFNACIDKILSNKDEK